MRFLLPAMESVSEFATLRSAVVSGRTPVVATGLAHIHKAIMINTLCDSLKRRALVVAADESEGSKLAEDLGRMGRKVIHIPDRDFVFRDISGVSREYEHARIGALSNLLQNNYDVAIASPDALLRYTMPPEVLSSCTFSLKSGDVMPVDQLCKKLTAAGYARYDQVEGPGQFAVRGGIADVFTPDSSFPARIEFWGDEIDSITGFDIVSQRRTDPLDEIFITPSAEVLFDPDVMAEKIRALARSLRGKEGVKENLLCAADSLDNGVIPRGTDRFIPLAYEKPACVLDYIGDSMLFLSETAKIKERCRTFSWQLNEDIKALMEENLLCKGLDRFCADMTDIISAAQNGVILETFARGSYPFPVKEAVNFTMRQTAAWNGSVELLKEDLLSLTGQKYSVAVLAGTRRAAENLADELSESGISAQFSDDPDSLTDKYVTVTSGGLSGGFDCPHSKISVIARGQSVQAAKPRRKRKKGEQINSLDELHSGDYVVHAAHGIGVFEGIHKIEIDKVTKDYLKIRYAKQDVLYVPVTQLDLVSKYIGNTDTNGLKLNRLGGSEWQKSRSRVKSAVKDMAKQLIKLYSERMKTPGHAFSADTDFQSDFERRFEYDETEDQLRCISEIKSDMERPVPMDRLLCGDVGFGKTEVALRAAFKCIADGRQCALLVPTTILAWQHYQTALRRMESMPVKVELLSRFRTAKQQEEILRQLARGEIDLIIGTHRLVSKDVKFRSLGLVIIDEEQRFGVAQKEKLKELSPTVDMLTLSATPIPRTLNMAMSGLRDMSSIDEAPLDRHPVQTYVLEYDFGILLDSVRRELGRGGQVYWLHNRTESINSCAAKIKAQLPDARIGVAHGKMSEEELSEIWRQLIDREIDILVCTTIIETGVDVPNVNTLIIENADRMGLSQLHQLRGRVGRSSRRAYAYFTFRTAKVLNETAQKRLEAIREFTEFGSGFKIALRDLEIRGAGNILGGEQHGHIDAVGYDMYIRLLSDAISEEKGEKTLSAPECTVDLQIEAHIPEKYISSLPARLGIYRRIADIRCEDDALDVTDELIDRFGDPPESVNGLITAALLRNSAAAAGISEIVQKNGSLLLFPHTVDPKTAAMLADKMKGRVTLSMGAKPYIAVRMLKGQKPVDSLKEIISHLQNVDICK